MEAAQRDWKAASNRENRSSMDQLITDFGHIQCIGLTPFLESSAEPHSCHTAFQKACTSTSEAVVMMSDFRAAMLEGGTACARCLARSPPFEVAVTNRSSR